MRKVTKREYYFKKKYIYIYLFAEDINAWLKSKFGQLQCDPHFSEYVELFKRMLLAKELKDMLVEFLKILFKIIRISYLLYNLLNKFLYVIIYNSQPSDRKKYRY